MPPQRQFRLLTTHYALYQLAVATAGGFAGAYLLKLGFSLPQALVAFAALLATRFVLRILSLALVRRIGYRGALSLGAAIVAAQFIPLMHADELPWLLAWLLAVSIGESLYWPVYHAAAAVTGGGASRGREQGLRTAVFATIGVIGPLVGGVLLERFGAVADFGLAIASMLLSIVPVLMMDRIKAGDVPGFGDSFDAIDRSGVTAFAADGFMSAGLALAWPMALFLSLGSGFETFGIANAVAGLAGAVVGVIAGHMIDRGKRDHSLVIVSWLLAASFAFRAAASFHPAAATIANVTGAAIGGLYSPIFMSYIYDRAKRTGAAYRFHVVAESGWDVGAALGCLAGAAATMLTGVPSLSTLPPALAIGIIYWCVRREPAHAARVETTEFAVRS